MNGNGRGGRGAVKHVISSHSLGTLIEWKRGVGHGGGDHVISSHSLGTLIEWKPTSTPLRVSRVLIGSHSLGTLIEWKHLNGNLLFLYTPSGVPTRWGH